MLQYQLDMIILILLIFLVLFLSIIFVNMLGRQIGNVKLYFWNSDTQMKMADITEVEDNISSQFTKIVKINKDDFLSSASRAYSLVVEAYANINMKILSELLDEKLYNTFKAAIEQRELLKHRMLCTNVNILSVELHDIVQTEDNTACVDILVRSERINYTVDEHEKIINGSMNHSQYFADICSFKKPKDNNSTWPLCSIRKF